MNIHGIFFRHIFSYFYYILVLVIILKKMKLKNTSKRKFRIRKTFIYMIITYIIFAITFYWNCLLQNEIQFFLQKLNYLQRNPFSRLSD